MSETSMPDNAGIPPRSAEGRRKRTPERGAQPIRRASLHQEVVRRVRDLIFQGELAPGARVPERMLCERFGISRTPLREALMVLAAEGLIDLSPHRGATVSRLSPDELDDMFQVMESLEGLAGELACARITDAEIEEIRGLHAQMRAHYESGDRLAYFQLNQRIHHRLVEVARNPVLLDVYTGLSGRIRRARYLANMDSDRWHQAIEEHEEILATLAARDGARLSQVLKDHLQHKYDVLKTVLLKEQP